MLFQQYGFFSVTRRPPEFTPLYSSAGSDVSKRQRERRVANLPRSGKVVDEARWAESMRAGERPGERRLLRRNAPRRVFMTPLRSGEVTPDETFAFCSLPAVRGASRVRTRTLLDPPPCPLYTPLLPAN